MGRSVLVIEDDRDIAELVALHLRDDGFEVELAADGETGLAAARDGGHDLVVLDLMLPGLDGLSVCRELRAGGRHIPVLMLTARSSEMDRVVGLELGADDYLTKPFSVRELVARVRALLRRVDALGRGGAEASERITVGGLAIDTGKRRVSVDGEEVELTAKEFDLLLHLASHPGRVYSRTQLLDQVWGYNHAGYEHTVNSHINRLRGKVEADPAKPRYVLTVWGVGYKLAEPKDLE